MERKTFVRRTAIFIAFAATGILGFILGSLGARRGATDADPAISVSMPYFPDCNGMPDGEARRNIVWRALNGDADALPRKSDPVAAITAEAVFMMLHPGAPPMARYQGAELYFRKAAKIMPPESAEDLDRAIDSGDLAGVANGMWTLNRLDRESAAFMACVLLDTERVSAFLRGEPVPLETVP